MPRSAQCINIAFNWVEMIIYDETISANIRLILKGIVSSYSENTIIFVLNEFQSHIES